MAVKRLIALDVLRGLTIALMIMVNSPGSWKYIYAPLKHSKWNGCTPTDLVFPFFLFIVGVSMWFSFKKFQNGITKSSLKKIIKRFLVIFILGLFLNAIRSFDWENLRIMGVLQRIAVAYLIGALLCLQFNHKQLIVAFCVILLGYWALLYFTVSEAPFELATNFVRKADISIFGEKHLYNGYGIPFDPEGLLSSIPSVGTIILGYFAGRIIELSNSTINTIKMMIFFGSALIVIGWLLGYLFPINKALWSSTYVLYTGGLAFLFLALLLWIIDVNNIKKWTAPFIHFGTNPLFIYMFSGVYIITLIYFVKINVDSETTLSGYEYLYQKVFVPIAGNMNGSLLFAVTHIIFFWLITYILYKRKIFIKI